MDAAEPGEELFHSNEEKVSPIEVSFKLKRTDKGHNGKLYGMQLNEEGNRLFSAAQDGQLILWDAHKGTMRKLVTPKSDWVLCCALNNSGTIGASGGMNNILSVYKLPEDGPVLIDGAEEEIALSGHDSAILHCRFRSSGGVADNGAEILSSSGDGTIKLWDVAKKTDITTLKGHTADVGQFEAFNVNNLISISGDHSCKIWDIRKPGGAVEGRDNVSTEGAHLSSLAVFPDSSKMIFACGDTNGVIKMFDLRMTEPMAIYDRPEIWETMVPDGAPPPKMGLCSLAFSNSGRLLLSSFYNVEDENEDSHILAWDTLKGDPVSEFQAGKKQPHVSNRVHSLQVSPCGRVLFGAGWDTNIYMWQGK